jgi:L-fuconolactonase
MSPAKVVDSHIHFWQLSNGYYTALEPHMTILLKDHLPDDLAPLLASAGVDQIVVVEAAETVEETHFVLSLAQKYPFIAGVVGWIDLESSDVESILRSMKSNPLYKGVRPLHDDNKKIHWMNDTANDIGFQALIDLGLSFDALVQNFNELPCIVSVAERFPKLSIILNHLGKPDIANNIFASWAADIDRLAKHPNVVCKFSGILNQAKAGWTLKGLRPYADHVLRCFGAERLMWGSDWPPARLTAEYNAGWKVAHELLTHLPAADQEMIFGGNATRIYRLHDGPSAPK